MTRRALIALTLAGCATAATPGAIPDALRGCWIERRGADTVTMRWFPERGSPSWRGDQLIYTPGEEPAHQAYRIQRATIGDETSSPWSVCPLDDGLPHGAPCRGVFFADGSREDYRAEIRASAERLRFAFIDTESELVFFNGARDGCD
jgi:hypothetical protein